MYFEDWSLARGKNAKGKIPTARLKILFPISFLWFCRLNWREGLHMLGRRSTSEL
jgi:hypothetical protein